jgi:hypothetical protein
MTQSGLAVRPSLGDAADKALMALNDATWAAVAKRSDTVTGEAVAIPPFIPAETVVEESRFSTDFPVLQHLPRAIELAKQGPLKALAEQFEAIMPHLRWSQNPNYTEENCDRRFLDGYAYAAFSGPQGPIHVDAPRGGFMLMGPDVLYKDHNHAPEEVYLILTPGAAQWRLDGGAWFDVGAGDLILHRPWCLHGMRTGGEPMLAFAGWTEPGARLEIGFSESA